jgi:hypothetical protein
VDGDPDRAPGFHTQQFIEYFFRDPDRAWGVLGDTAALRSMFTEEMHGLFFLDQACLNESLAEFLARHGYSSEETELVRRAGRIRPVAEHAAGTGWTTAYSARLGAALAHRPDLADPSEEWDRRLTPGLRAFIRARERLLFEQFPWFAS